MGTIFSRIRHEEALKTFKESVDMDNSLVQGIAHLLEYKTGRQEAAAALKMAMIFLEHNIPLFMEHNTKDIHKSLSKALVVYARSLNIDLDMEPKNPVIS